MSSETKSTTSSASHSTVSDSYCLIPKLLPPPSAPPPSIAALNQNWESLDFPFHERHQSPAPARPLARLRPPESAHDASVASSTTESDKIRHTTSSATPKSDTIRQTTSSSAPDPTQSDRKRQFRRMCRLRPPRQTPSSALMAFPKTLPVPNSLRPCSPTPSADQNRPLPATPGTAPAPVSDRLGVLVPPCVYARVIR